MIHIGILGSSSYSLRAVVPELMKLDKYVNSITIATRTPSKVNYLVCDKLNVIDEYDKLVYDSNVEAIYIALPNALHFNYARKALLAGKAVLVEKPLALNIIEASKLLEIAENRKIPIVEAFQFRFHSQLEQLNRMLDAGVIGDIRCYRTSFGVPPFQSRTNIRYQKILGGGAAYDLAVYPLRLAPFLMGPDLTVVHSMKSSSHGFEVDLYGGGTVRQTNGSVFMQFAYGFDHFYRCELEVWASKGVIRMNRIFTAPPDFSPTIHLFCQDGETVMSLQSDNQYRKLLEYFFESRLNTMIRESEYTSILLQARLVSEFIFTNLDTSVVSD